MANEMRIFDISIQLRHEEKAKFNLYFLPSLVVQSLEIIIYFPRENYVRELFFTTGQSLSILTWI